MADTSTPPAFNRTASEIYALVVSDRMFTETLPDTAIPYLGAGWFLFAPCGCLVPATFFEVCRSRLAPCLSIGGLSARLLRLRKLLWRLKVWLDAPKTVRSRLAFCRARLLPAVAAAATVTV